MMTAIIILGVSGFVISVYTYLLERKIKRNPEFKPACDLSDRISCTKPMLSPYANIFFFSNAIVSTAYYILVIILAAIDSPKLLFIAAISACLVSAFLAYLLYFKIKSFCILCTSLYIINILILILITYRVYFQTAL